jgi:hypothetical protein
VGVKAVHQTGFSTDDKGSITLDPLIAACENYTTAVHEIKGIGLWNAHVKDFDLVQFILGHMDRRRDLAAQIALG